MSVEELINKLATNVDGANGTEEDILVFALSTCMWCKKCKRFLNEEGMKYRYIDVDKIDPGDKMKLLEHLRTTYEDRISYPFFTCKSGHVVGYDPKQYKKLLME